MGEVPVAQVQSVLASLVTQTPVEAVAVVAIYKRHVLAVLVSLFFQ